MSTIGFLHTSPVHVATFDTLLATSGADVRAVHVVDEALLADARVLGIDAVRDRFAERLAEASEGVDVVCCTCSTLGGLAEQLGAPGLASADLSLVDSDGEFPRDESSRHEVPVIRVDRPMARRAVELGERVAVIATVTSTVEPSYEVLLSEAARARRAVQLDAHVVEEAWEAFAAGDLDDYERQVADACRRAAADADVIVLAQASMAGAVEQLDDLDIPVLASPALAVEFLLGNLGAGGGPVNRRFWDVEVIGHANLSRDDLAGLQALFDAEYLAEYGPWSPASPYGYSGHDVHVIARDGDGIVGHVGWARRVISVGDQEVVIAGVGGVLVAPSVRGTSLGQSLMCAAVDAMRAAGGIEYGYLGCREAVAAFYASCGWTRIAVAERCVDRVTGETTTDPPRAPHFIRGVLCDETEWPSGLVDLRGRPW